MNIIELFFGAVFLFFFIAFILIVFLVVKMTKKQFKPKTEEEARNEKEQLNAIASQGKAKLEAWEDDSYSLIAYKKSLDLLGKGPLYICAVGGKQLLSCKTVNRAISISRTYFYLAGVSTQDHYEIELNQANEFVAHINGERLGFIQNYGQVLLDKNRQSIGQAPHPSQMSVSLNNLGAAKQIQYPVHINGKHLADMNVKLDPVNHDEENIFWKDAPIEIIPVVDLVGMPTAEEKKWLTILAILEITFYT